MWLSRKQWRRRQERTRTRWQISAWSLSQGVLLAWDYTTAKQVVGRHVLLETSVCMATGQAKSGQVSGRNDLSPVSCRHRIVVETPRTWAGAPGLLPIARVEFRQCHRTVPCSAVRTRSHRLARTARSPARARTMPSTVSPISHVRGLRDGSWPSGLTVALDASVGANGWARLGMRGTTSSN